MPPRPQEQPREGTGYRDLTSFSISSSLWPFLWSSCLEPGWRLLRTEETPGWHDGSLYVSSHPEGLGEGELSGSCYLGTFHPPGNAQV